MKTKVITEVESTEIDWSKVNLVRSDNGSGRIVLTNGIHLGDTFEGTAVFKGNNSDYQAGEHRTDWRKIAFNLITEQFTIEFNSK